MLQFPLLTLQFSSCALTDLPLCQVSPYSPPPLMFATARTPPRCRTKISLDTLKKHTDKRIIFIFQFLYTYHVCKNTLRERSLLKSVMKLWIKSLLMANLRIFSLVIHGNETPSSFRRGRNQCWFVLPPLVLLLWREWPVVWPNRWPLRMCHHLLKLSSKPLVCRLELCSTTGPPQLFELFLFHLFPPSLLQRGKEGWAQRKKSKN